MPPPEFYIVSALMVLKTFSIIIFSSPLKTLILRRANSGTNSKLVELMRGFFAVVLGGIAFSGLRNKRPGEDEPCKNVDADIVGDGVRIAAWVQQGLLALTTLGGTFHAHSTAIKEIGGGLLVTHVSLAVALLCPLGMRKLSPIDAALGSMILDAQNIALAIQLRTKDTLAARWQVYVVLAGQMGGLVILGVLMGSFSSGGLVTENCKCFSVFWWTWLGNCSTVSPYEMIPFWLYYGLRWIMFIECVRDATTVTELFNFAEQHREMAVIGGLRWEDLTASTSLLYLEYAWLAVFSMSAAEVTMALYKIHKSSPLYSIGQVSAIVVAGETAVRAAWVTWFYFWRRA